MNHDVLPPWSPYGAPTKFIQLFSKQINAKNDNCHINGYYTNIHKIRKCDKKKLLNNKN